MPNPQPWTDVYTLLCERCGYVIEGLDPAGSCPECGKPIADSLPARRTGTPAQNHPGLVAWLATGASTMLRPTLIFASLRIAPRADRRLFVRNLLFTSAAAGAVLYGTWLAAPHGPIVRTPNPSIAWTAQVAIALATAASCAAAFAVLTWIESRGVVFFSARRAWRVDREIARAICAHAAFAWWIAGLGVAAGLIAAPHFDRAVSTLTAGTPFALFAPAAPVLLGFALGVLPFELLVYAGVRACKFANRPRPAG